MKTFREFSEQAYTSKAQLDEGLGTLLGKAIKAVAKPIIKAGAPKGLSSRGLKTSATGVNKAGFDALTSGAKFRQSSKPQILGRGAYQAPKVGRVGKLRQGGSFGASSYAGSQGSLGGAQQPGGVIASLTPKGAWRLPIIEPQRKVSPKTFDRGAQIVRDIQGGKYTRSAKARQIQQQLKQTGFGAGESSIPFEKLPKGGRQAQLGAWFNKGKNTRIPDESRARFGTPLEYFKKNPNPKTLFGDDALQRGQSNAAYKAGEKPSLFGRPDRAFGIDLVQSVKKRKLVKVPASEGGPGSGPTPITRELVKRPLRTVKRAAKKLSGK